MVSVHKGVRISFQRDKRHRYLDNNNNAPSFSPLCPEKPCPDQVGPAQDQDVSTMNEASIFNNCPSIPTPGHRDWPFNLWCAARRAPRWILVMNPFCCLVILPPVSLSHRTRLVPWPLFMPRHHLHHRIVTYPAIQLSHAPCMVGTRWHLPRTARVYCDLA